jgi:hypothetical protein
MLNMWLSHSSDLELGLPPASAGFFLGLLFGSGDADIFFRNVGFLPNYTAIKPRWPYSSVYRRL